MHEAFGGRARISAVLGWHSSAPLRKLGVYLADSSLLFCTCVLLCMLMSVFLFSLKQTNGYDGGLYGSQSLSRRSGRVSIVHLHG